MAVKAAGEQRQVAVFRTKIEPRISSNSKFLRNQTVLNSDEGRQRLRGDRLEDSKCVGECLYNSISAMNDDRKNSSPLHKLFLASLQVHAS